jgi:hypothetical protein
MNIVKMMRVGYEDIPAKDMEIFASRAVMRNNKIEMKTPRSFFFSLEIDLMALAAFSTYSEDFFMLLKKAAAEGCSYLMVDNPDADKETVETRDGHYLWLDGAPELSNHAEIAEAEVEENCTYGANYSAPAHDIKGRRYVVCWEILQAKGQEADVYSDRWKNKIIKLTATRHGS